MAPRESISLPGETLARALGLRRSGKRYTGNCPACDYKNAFYVRDGDRQPLVFCHACQDTDAVVTALQHRGLWQKSSPASTSIGSAPEPTAARRRTTGHNQLIQKAFFDFSCGNLFKEMPFGTCATTIASKAISAIGQRTRRLMTAEVVASFMLKHEVEKVHPVSDRARKRAETAGLFPPRVALALHKPGWRRSEVVAWEADPAAWATARLKSVK
jgi:hypothetical protein